MPNPNEAANDAGRNEALEAWLNTRLPGVQGLAISTPRAPGAGESSDTRLFEIRFERAGQSECIPAVLRCAPSQAGPFPEYDLPMQFHLMRALDEARVLPVPEALWLEEDPSILGVPFLVMRQVTGDAPLDRPSYQVEGFYFEAEPALRAHMWERTIADVARLHAADWRALGAGRVLGTRPGDDPHHCALDYWRDYLENFLKDDPEESVPVYDEALAYLESERPDSDRLALLWGDAKLGNVMYAPETRDVAAIIDWEMATIGHPEMDLASLHLSDLRAQDLAGGRALEGTPSADELVALYEKHSGRPVEHFDYHLVFATFWRGSVQLAVMRQYRARGAEIDDALFTDNFPTNKLRELLGLERAAG